MRVLHGSNKVIESPTFGWGNPNNDYGLGFYTTEDFALASEWAVGIDHDGYINKYDIDESKFNVFNLDSMTVLHWAATIFRYRYDSREWGVNDKDVKYLIDNFAVTASDYDIMIGNRADDAYFAIMESFANGTLSAQDLERATRFGEWGRQIVLISKNVMESVVFADYDPVSRKEWYQQRRMRNNRATSLYLKMLEEKRFILRDSQNSELKIGIIANERLTDSSPEIKALYPPKSSSVLVRCSTLHNGCDGIGINVSNLGRADETDKQAFDVRRQAVFDQPVEADKASSNIHQQSTSSR